MLQEMINQAICFNCGKKAEHEHHVVPKSLGGLKTVPLCLECHQKIHGKKLGSGYLTKYALMKKQREELCRIFYLLLWEGSITNNVTLEYIAKDLKSLGVNVKAAWVRSAINRMKSIYIEDLIALFQPILLLTPEQKEWVKKTWDELYD